MVKASEYILLKFGFLWGTGEVWVQIPPCSFAACLHRRLGRKRSEDAALDKLANLTGCARKALRANWSKNTKLRAQQAATLLFFGAGPPEIRSASTTFNSHTSLISPMTDYENTGTAKARKAPVHRHFAQTVKGQDARPGQLRLLEANFTAVGNGTACGAISAQQAGRPVVAARRPLPCPRGLVPPPSMVTRDAPTTGAGPLSASVGTQDRAARPGSEGPLAACF